ncbi:conserved hypothetical protein [Xanthomonas citri pv. fuscans]|nr:conserved hypothetical protein [Xanthomonas citri pv. fuscans]SOO31787.1 conserved hypothetical protein [Xanthomonas citri pv. fuscans]
MRTRRNETRQQPNHKTDQQNVEPAVATKQMIHRSTEGGRDRQTSISDVAASRSGHRSAQADALPSGWHGHRLLLPGTHGFGQFFPGTLSSYREVVFQ